ncbi:lysine-rich arabinogalactan protein 19-like [Sceloporus undulatus]|uniref:lysine-rich arabinogalactan protein 19-like n=1 Tax=Sceloporus undulatus TaxID=8520 RepID=UPI001C4B4713|nr:lysine-rich arabinogalactan protein 19-like [Sceloporus undulatus]
MTHRLARSVSPCPPRLERIGNPVSPPQLPRGRSGRGTPPPASAPSAPTAAPPTSAHASPALASVAHDLGQTVPVPAVGYGSSKASAASKPTQKPKKSDAGTPSTREEATTSKQAATGHKSHEAAVGLEP